MSSNNTDLAIHGSNLLDYIDILRKLDSSRVPAKYVEKIIVTLKDESVVELSGEEFSEPLPVEGFIQWNKIKDMFDGVASMKMHLNLDLIEIELERKLEDIYRVAYRGE